MEILHGSLCMSFIEKIANYGKFIQACLRLQTPCVTYSQTFLQNKHFICTVYPVKFEGICQMDGQRCPFFWKSTLWVPNISFQPRRE